MHGEKTVESVLNPRGNDEVALWRKHCFAEMFPGQYLNEETFCEKRSRAVY